MCVLRASAPTPGHLEPGRNRWICSGPFLLQITQSNLFSHCMSLKSSSKGLAFPPIVPSFKHLAVATDTTCFSLARRCSAPARYVYRLAATGQRYIDEGCMSTLLGDWLNVCGVPAYQSPGADFVCPFTSVLSMSNTRGINVNNICGEEQHAVCLHFRLKPKK